MRDKNIDNDINSNIDSVTPDETELEGVAEETSLGETPSEEEVVDNTNHESEETTNNNSEVDDDQEPTVRDNSYYARKRIEEREAKKRKQQSFEEQENEEDGYDYIDDYDEKKFDALLKKKGIDVEFFKNSIEENQTKNDVGNFFSDNQNKEIFGKFEKKITRYANHPSRKNIPIESIAYEVAGPSLVKELQDLRQEVAKYTKNKGTGVSGTAGNSSSAKQLSPEDVLNMSKEDYQKYMAKFRK